MAYFHLDSWTQTAAKRSAQKTRAFTGGEAAHKQPASGRAVAEKSGFKLDMHGESGDENFERL
ncbi:MAG: hypothetical protein ACOCWR_11600 [Oceanidesulfovibrio sp.]